MDDTQHTFVPDGAPNLMERLAASDPADAPAVAEQLATELAERLDGPASASKAG